MTIKMIKALAAATMLAGALVSAPAVAQTTVGNPAVERGNLDSSATLTFVLDEGFGALGRLDTFSFFAGRAGDVTPLLFTRNDTAGSIDFTLTGVGTTRNATSGVNSFGFGLTQGSDLTGPMSFFGFRTNSVGVVTYGYQSDTLPGTFAKVRTGDMVGSVLSFDPNNRASDTGDGLNFRGYSINAVAGAVPEPATWAMMLVGFGAVGAGMRSRRRSTKVSFA